MLVGATLSAYHRGELTRVSAALLIPTMAAIHVALLSTSAILPVALQCRLTFLGTIVAFCAIAVGGRPRDPHRLTNFFADIS
jgi:hypothetical protein